VIEADTVYTVAGWASVNNTPDGRLMWDVVRDYILAAKGEDDVLVLQKINHPKLVNVADDPGIADYPGEMS
jgi:sulfur-oxidizing protein SoxB